MQDHDMYRSEGDSGRVRALGQKFFILHEGIETKTPK